MRSKGLFIIFVALLFIAACGSEFESESPPTATPVTPSAISTEPVATKTSSTDTPKATITAEEWDYVFLGSSVTRGYPYLLKEQIEEYFEGQVTVAVHDWHQNEQSSSSLLNALQTNENLRESIREAELITLYIPPDEWDSAVRTFDNGGPCGGPDNQDCLRDALATYKANTTAIFAELVDLRSPSEALIRAHDMYQLMTSRLQDHEIFDVVNGYWRAGNSHVHSVAESYGIPVANVYDAFMGEDGAQPPEDQGLVIGDMVHTTPEGQQLIADLLHDLGYGLATP